MIQRINLHILSQFLSIQVLRISASNNNGTRKLQMSPSMADSLCEKCPNTKFFLVRIFLHSCITSYLSVFSPNAGKYGPEKTPYLDTFPTVIVMITMTVSIGGLFYYYFFLRSWFAGPF